MLHVKAGIFLEKSDTREHRNFKLIYNYQVFSWKSQIQENIETSNLYTFIRYFPGKVIHLKVKFFFWKSHIHTYIPNNTIM